jgi:hypothetical protein
MLRADMLWPTRDSGSSLSEVGVLMVAAAVDAGAFCDPCGISLPDTSSGATEGKTKLGLERREPL